MIKWYWMSTSRMTVGIITKDGIIIDCAPIVRKFIGQKIDNLRNWLNKQPGFIEECI